ncbi:hypothetical protein ACI1TM_08555 [Lactococcus garvieae]
MTKEICPNCKINFLPEADKKVSDIFKSVKEIEIIPLCLKCVAEQN